MTASQSKNCFSPAPGGRLALAFVLSAAAAAAVYPAAGPSSRDVILPTRIKAPIGEFEYSIPVGPLAPVTSLAFSPDGRLLAAGEYRAVTIWDITKGQPSARIGDLAGQVESVAFHPGGEFLAVAGGEPGKSAQALVFSLHDLSRRTYLLGHADAVNCIAWNRDGTALVTAGTDKTSRVWGWPGGLVRMVLRGHADAVTRACFSADSRSVYTASLDRNVRKFDTSTGAIQKTFSAAGEAISSLAISADGKQIVSSGPEARIRWWNADNGETGRYSYGSGEVNDLCFSKDGKALVSASADGAVRLWNVDNGALRATLTGSKDWVFAAAVRPDGKVAVGGGADGIVRVWELESGRLRVLLLGDARRDPLQWLAVTPEGFYDGSDAWRADVRPVISGKIADDPNVIQFARSLRQPDSVESALKLTDLKPAELPAAPKPDLPSKKG